MATNMDETDKVVAAILSVAYAAKDGGVVNPTDYVDAYEKIYGEIKRREEAREKERSAAFAAGVKHFVSTI
jgi:hypothetical protein